MIYPVPFATIEDVVRLGVEAEQLGFYDVAGNDHLSTQRYVREAWSQPPDYFEPLISHAYLAARTSVVRLTTGVLQLPLRDPVVLAKQAATLDRLSGGRVTLGVAVGGYRDEFQSVVPRLAGVPRADLMRENLEALRCLFDRRVSTYQGKHVRFEDVEMYPKPVQTPLPIYSGGNSDGAIRRAAELCDGWLPAKLGVDGVREGRAKLERYARAAGRDPKKIGTAMQLVVCLARTNDEAWQIYDRSPFEIFRASLSGTMLKGVGADDYKALNLVGTPDEVCARIAALEEAGVSHLCSLLFVGNTVEEMLGQIREFARVVMPAFAG
jgi:probable F420-dependent oxidoreductase